MATTVARLARLERVQRPLDDTRSTALHRIEAGEATGADIIRFADIGLWRSYIVGSTELVAIRERLLVAPQGLGLASVLINLSRLVAFPPDLTLPPEVEENYRLAAWMTENPGGCPWWSPAELGTVACWTLALGPDWGIGARRAAWSQGPHGWRISPMAPHHAQLHELDFARGAEAFAGVRLTGARQPGLGRSGNRATLAQVAELLKSTRVDGLVPNGYWRLRSN